MKSHGWALIWHDWCPYKKRRFGHTHTHTDVKPWKPQGEGGHLQAKDRYLTGERRRRRRKKPAITLILAFQPSNSE